MSVRDFIGDVVGELNGFVISDPWRLGDDSLGVIVPIVRNTKGRRKYITLAEAKSVRMTDTGRIDAVNVENNGDTPIYVSRGEIFKGATQERAAIHGCMINPGQNVNVAVRCIHQTKGIKPGEQMTYGGKVPYMVDLFSQQKAWDSVRQYSHLTNGTSDQVVYTAISGALNQFGNPHGTRSIFTNAVSNTFHDGHHTFGRSEPIIGSQPMAMYTSSVNLSASMDSCDPSQMEKLFTNQREAVHVEHNIPQSDDLVSTLDGMAAKIEEALRKIPPVKNQVGAIFLEDNQILGLDIYDLPLSWDAIKKDVIKKEGSAFVKKESDNLFEFKPEKVKAFLAKRLNTVFEEKVIYSGNGFQVIEVREQSSDPKAKRLMGEAVVQGETVVHLTMYRM